MVKKVLYSPGFGCGFAYGLTNGKTLAEDPTLIELVEKGEHMSGNKVSAAFRERLREIDPEEADYVADYVSTRGIENLKVTTVEGPYRIEEYDGAESILERDKAE